MYVYKITVRFNPSRKYKLIKLLTFIWVPYKTYVGNLFANVIILFFSIRQAVTSENSACRRELERL